MKFKLVSLQNTEAIATVIADYIRNSNNFCTFLLYGNLGTGKTTLVRYILKDLGWNKSVKSPTFSIVEEYTLMDKDIFHADLYRLENLNDFEMLGLEINYSKPGVIFVEWPDIISKELQGKVISIRIIMDKNIRFLEFETNCQDFLASIDRVNI